MKSPPVQLCCSPTISDKPVGQVGNLRPIGNRPRAGPRKLLRHRHQPRIHRVHFDVADNSPKLSLVPNEPIIAFILPEGLTSETEHLVTLPRRESLKRLHHFGNIDARSHKQMNMIRHYDKRVEIEFFRNPIAIVNGLNYQDRDFRTTKVQRASLRVIPGDDPLREMLVRRW
jgi:hypothetical protein